MVAMWYIIEWFYRINKQNIALCASPLCNAALYVGFLVAFSQRIYGTRVVTLL